MVVALRAWVCEGMEGSINPMRAENLWAKKQVRESSSPAPHYRLNEPLLGYPLIGLLPSITYLRFTQSVLGGVTSLAGNSIQNGNSSFWLLIF